MCDYVQTEKIFGILPDAFPPQYSDIPPPAPAALRLLKLSKEFCWPQKEREGTAWNTR